MTSSFIHKYADTRAWVQIQLEMNSKLTTFSGFYTILQVKTRKITKKFRKNGATDPMAFFSFLEHFLMSRPDPIFRRVHESNMNSVLIMGSDHSK